MKQKGFTILLILALVTIFHLPSASAREDYGAVLERECNTCHIDSYYPGGDFFEAETIYKWKMLRYMSESASLIFLFGIIYNLVQWGRGKKLNSKAPSKSQPVMNADKSEAGPRKGIFNARFIRLSIFFGVSVGFIALFIVFLTFNWLRASTGHLHTELTTLQQILDSLLDFCGVLILLGILMAIVKRYVLNSALKQKFFQDTATLIFIFLIIFSGFLLEGFRSAALPSNPAIQFSFMGSLLGFILKPMQLPWTVYHFYLWIVHGLIAVAFVAYIPFSKIRYFFAHPFSIFATVK